MRLVYDLVANIAAEEYGHIELVAAAINTMLTSASANKKAPNLNTGMRTTSFHFAKPVGTSTSS